MLAQNLIIYKFSKLYHILEEINSELNFNILFADSENILNDTIKNLNNYLIITDREYLNIGNQFILNDTPVNISKFIEEGSKWWKGFEKSKHVGSMFGVRVVLPNRHHDDARPTTIRKINDNLYTIFSGKIGTCVSIAD